MKIPTCKTCGKVPPKTPALSSSQWQARAYCGPECRPFVFTSLNRDELVLEIRMLLDYEPWLKIAERLNYKPGSLMRRLRRMGYLDWSRAIERDLKHEQRQMSRAA